MSPRTPFYSVLLFALVCVAQEPPKPEDALKLVVLQDIKVVGSRLPGPSVIRLSGMKIGEKVNDLIVNQACHKVTATGLVKSIDYFYDLYPDKAGVALTLKLTDEGMPLPATIKPAADDGPLWDALLELDPIFSRQLPPTEKALNFYATNISKVLDQQGRKGEYAAPSVAADSNGALTAIVFEIRTYKTINKPRGQ